MKKSKVYLALLAAVAIQVPTYSFAAEAESDKKLTAKEVALAKKAADKEIEVVEVVSGFAASEAEAINMKKFADTISANLSAEDIGALPDQSIAESLQRLTGVTGNQDQGRSNTINVRGLGGGYTMSTLNGREIVSSFGSRSVNLALFPGEAIRRAQVFKTAMSDSLEGGIGGTVNMETIKPLGLEKDVRSFSAQYNGNSNFKDVQLGETYGSRLSGIFSHHFSDTLAIAVGAAYQSDPQYLESYKANELIPLRDRGLVDGKVKNFNVPDLYSQGAHVFRTQKRDIERSSIFATAQWQVNDDLLITVDGLSSDYDFDQHMNVQVFSVWGNQTLVPGSIVSDENGIVSGGSATINKLTSAPVSVINEDATDAYGINFAYAISDDVTLDVDLSRSTADRIYSWRGAWDNFAPGIDHHFTWDTTARDPKFEYHGSDVNGDGNLTDILNDSSYYTFGGVSNGLGHTVSANTAIKADLTIDTDLDFFHQFKVGFRSSKNEKDFMQSGGEKHKAEFFGEDFDIGDYQKTIIGSRYGTYDSIQGLDHAFYYDVNDILTDNADILPERTQTRADRSESYDLTEDTFAFYVQTSFAGDWFDGTFGVRYYKTKLDSGGEQFIPSIKKLGWGNNEYKLVLDGANENVVVRSKVEQSDFLPTLNVNLRLIDDVVIRIGAGKAMIRPGIADLNNGIKLRGNIKGGERFGDDWDAESASLGKMGNPDLDYITSKQADVSFEYYPNRTDFAALAFFYKDLDALYAAGFIDIEMEGLDTTSGDQASMPLTQQTMAEGGSVNGVEFSFRKNLGFIADFLHGVNVSGNWMKFNSQATQDYNRNGIPRWGDNGQPTELPYTPLGWIDETWNLTFTYDITQNLSARYNINAQGEMPMGNVNNGEYGLRLPSTTHAASMRYNVNKNFTLIGQVGNITDEQQVESQLALRFFDTPQKQLLREQLSIGVSYYVGASYRF